jgi:hypothetical protein
MPLIGQERPYRKVADSGHSMALSSQTSRSRLFGNTRWSFRLGRACTRFASTNRTAVLRHIRVFKEQEEQGGARLPSNCNARGYLAKVR